MSTYLTSASLNPLDTVAIAHHCQITEQDGKRVYTCRELEACHEIYTQIKNRTQADAVEIRKGVGVHYKLVHPTPLSRLG